MTPASFPSHPAVRLLLAGPSLVWSRAMAIRNRWYDRPGTSLQVDVPVISVGNLTVGGTGKTPVVEAICRMLLQDKRRPAVISRGYGGQAGKGPLVVSRGQGPEISSARCGDEPFQLATALPEIIVVVGSDRFTGSLEAIDIGADILVLDDGFQHRRLYRDLDICLLDASEPAITAEVLPAGPLRESFQGISRAGLILLTRAEPGIDLADTIQEIRRWNQNAPVVTASHVPTGFITGDRIATAAPERAFAFCGIANPQFFRSTLEELGIVLTGFRSFQDHHRYSLEEISELREEAARGDATLVTTEKDLARLSALNVPGSDHPLLALKIGITFHHEETVADTVQAIFSGIGRL